MKAITYRNTKTTLPGWVNNVHEGNELGYAYETNTHFVHFYGKDGGWNVISHGLTVTEKKSGLLEDWVIKTFGAIDIKTMELEPGNVIKCVWRPGLYFFDDTFKAFNITTISMRLAEQALKLLINKLDELFIYIEPDITSLNTYSHKTRELLILACTEAENFWTIYMNYFNTAPNNGRTFTTNDYVKLASKLYLNEYEFTLKAYSGIPPVVPFRNWQKSSPTQSLKWYDGYNKTKHDRNTHFSEASLSNCIEAVVANLVLFSTMFSPYPLFDQSNTFSSLVNQHFELKLLGSSPTQFYVPLINTKDIRENLICFDSHKLYEPFTEIKLTL